MGNAVPDLELRAASTATTLVASNLQLAETAIGIGDLPRAISALNRAHEILVALVGQVEALERIAEATTKRE